MLTDDFPSPDPFTDQITRMIANGRPTERVQQGVYRRYHFGSSNAVPGWNDGWGGDLDEFLERQRNHPDDSLVVFGYYGVADNVEQILAKYPELEADNGRRFVVFVTPVRKDEEPSSGGWRWHKWGPYIGDHDPQYEYLYHETGIEEVLCYHIYEDPSDET